MQQLQMCFNLLYALPQAMYYVDSTEGKNGRKWNEFRRQKVDDKTGKLTNSDRIWTRNLTLSEH